MSEWAARRFWDEARVVSSGAGFAIELDGRPVRCPSGQGLVLPNRALAEAVAAEWDAQGDRIDPLSMPTTRAANTALDKIAPEQDAYVSAIAAYAETDLLSHRAATPEALSRRQSALWDPLLDWAAERFGARLSVVAGVMPAAQDPVALERLAAPLRQLSAFQLAAMAELVGLSGSLVIGLAAAEGVEPPETLWDLSRLDEEWQAEQWGRDAEADAAAAAKRAAFLQAHRFLDLASRGN